MKKQMFILTVSLILSPLIGSTVEDQDTTEHEPTKLQQIAAKGIVGAVTSAFGFFSIAGMVNTCKLFRESSRFNLKDLTNIVAQTPSHLGDVLSKNPVKLKKYVDHLGKDGLKAIPAINKALARESNEFQELIQKANITDVVFDQATDGKILEFTEKINVADINSTKAYLVNMVQRNLFQRGIIGITISTALLALTVKMACEYFFKEKNIKEEEQEIDSRA